MIASDTTPTEATPGSLWRHADFLKLWAGQTISLFGTLIGRFALPLVAILTLNATPVQVALLSAAEVAPALVFGLAAGVWADRLRRRPLLLLTDLLRALAFISVPLAYLLGRLTFAHLLLVAIIGSTGSIFFEVAYRSYLPELVRGDQLVRANSRLASTDALAEIGGFGLAGFIVQFFGAPLGVLVDALTFLASALSLALIRHPDHPPPPASLHSAPASGYPPDRPTARQEIAEGLRLIRHHATLRTIAIATTIDQFFIHCFVAVLPLFIYRELGLPPAVAGIIFGIGGISSFGGSLLATRLIDRFGLGRTYIGAFIGYRLSTYLTGLAGGPLPLQVTLLSAAQLSDATYTVQSIAEMSLIQQTAPGRLIGRFYASLQTLQRGAMLLGLLLGGALGGWASASGYGVRPTLLFGITGALLAVPVLLRSPLLAGDRGRNGRMVG